MSPKSLLIEVPGHGDTSATMYAAESRSAGATLVLAHGAGAGQNSAFMREYAAALASRGVDVVTFDFLYTHNHRRLPDRGPLLELTYRAVVDTISPSVAGTGRKLFVGGKSMGGRIATQLAAAAPGLPLSGIVLLGYPLHPPGRPEQRRDRHLPAIRVPMLFVQGERDTFGTPDELRPVLDTLTSPAVLHVIPGGDHSFAVRARERSAAATPEAIQNVIVEWMRSVTDTSAP